MSESLTANRFARDPTCSSTLDRRMYFDPAVFEAERELIFRRAWKYGGHVSELPNAGSYLVVSVAGESVIILRDTNHKLRAFYNVCQHRAHRLVKGSGHLKNIRCPYHSWTYGLDGRLIAAPGSRGQIRCEDFALQPVQIEVFKGFIFLNLDPHAASFALIADGFQRQILETVPDLANLRKTEEWCEERHANWKLIIENDLECYHCRGAHPYLASRIGLKDYRSVDTGLWTTHFVASSSSKDSQEGADDGLTYWYFWPDTEARTMPGPLNFAWYTLEPLGPELTRLHYHHFAGDNLNTTDLEKIRHNPADDPTVAEDVALVESVQQGLRSEGYRGGAFVVNPDNELTEHSVHHFQTLVADALATASETTSLQINAWVTGESRARPMLAEVVSKERLVIRTPLPLRVGTTLSYSLQGETARYSGKIIACLRPGLKSTYPDYGMVLDCSSEQNKYSNTDQLTKETSNPKQDGRHA